MIAKSTAIKDRGGKSGGRAAKAVDLTSGDLCCVLKSGLRLSQGGLTAAQKSAEGIVGGAIRRRPERMEMGRRARISRMTWDRTALVSGLHTRTKGSKEKAR